METAVCMWVAYRKLYAMIENNVKKRKEKRTISFVWKWEKEIMSINLLREYNLKTVHIGGIGKHGRGFP